MSDFVEVTLAAILVIAAVVPFSIAFSKARKEMEAEESEENDV